MKKKLRYSQNCITGKKSHLCLSAVAVANRIRSRGGFHSKLKKTKQKKPLQLLSNLVWVGRLQLRAVAQIFASRVFPPTPEKDYLLNKCDTSLIAYELPKIIVFHPLFIT